MVRIRGRKRKELMKEKRKPNNNEREHVQIIGKRRNIENIAEIEEVHKDRIITNLMKKDKT